VVSVPKPGSPIGKFHSTDVPSAQIVIGARNAIRNVLREKEEVGVPIAGMNISRDRLRGGRDEKIVIEEQEDIEFDTWLKDLKLVKWPQAWERFWLG
jgi:tRNA-binding EMAP/Myf-like protein